MPISPRMYPNIFENIYANILRLSNHAVKLTANNHNTKQFRLINGIEWRANECVIWWNNEMASNELYA